MKTQSLSLFTVVILAISINNTSLAMSQTPTDTEYCLVSEYASATEAQARLHVDGNLIKDNQGRTVLLRGVNISGDSKVPPFMPITDAAMLDPLPGWGLNTLRLLFTWEAFEPTRCNYDSTYLDYYEQVVSWTNDRNIFVIVDFHQDAYSRCSIDGCGEDFPEWTIYSSIERKEPDNGEAYEDWGTKMISDLSHHDTWHHFYANSEGAHSRYIDTVQAVDDRM